MPLQMFMSDLAFAILYYNTVLNIGLPYILKIQGHIDSLEIMLGFILSGSW